jgi:hypothetical protein
VIHTESIGFAPLDIVDHNDLRLRPGGFELQPELPFGRRSPREAGLKTRLYVGEALRMLCGAEDARSAQ